MNTLLFRISSHRGSLYSLQDLRIELKSRTGISTILVYQCQDLYSYCWKWTKLKTLARNEKWKNNLITISMETILIYNIFLGQSFMKVLLNFLTVLPFRFLGWMYLIYDNSNGVSSVTSFSKMDQNIILLCNNIYKLQGSSVQSLLL